MDALQKKRLHYDKKNFARRQYGQTCREAIFIKDYIHIKYVDAYQEAATFYNYVNSMYPTKPDLRKTDEFKAMRKGFTFVAKNKDTTVKNPLQVFQPIKDLSEQNFVIHCYNVPLQPEPTEPLQSEPTEPLQSQPTEPLQSEPTEPLQSQPTEPLQSEPTEPLQSQPTEPLQSEPTEPLQSQPTEPLQSGTTGKTMQLRIPLLSPPAVTQIIAQGTIQDNILTTACNETIPAEDDIQPVFNDLIPQETYEAILKELHRDPDLAKLMDDVEIDAWDDIDMLDLPIEEDGLEQELCNIW